MSGHERKLLIVGAGAVAGFFILKSKGGTNSALGKVASALGIKPASSTAVARPTGTSIATRGGTAINPNLPTSGLGFNASRPTVGQLAPGVAQRQPVSVPAAIAAGGIGAGIAALSAWLRGKPPTTAARPVARPGTAPPLPQAQKPSSGSSGGASSGGGGGAPSGGASGKPSNGGSAFYSPVNQGFYDSNGQWVPTDEYGNVVADQYGNLPGYYNELGEYQSYSATQVLSGGFDENGNWVADGSTPVVPGGFDENGNWGPVSDVAVDETGNVDYGTVLDDGSSAAYYDDASGGMVFNDSGSTPVETGSFDDQGWWMPDLGAVDQTVAGDTSFDPAASGASDSDWYDYGGGGGGVYDGGDLADSWGHE